MSFFEQKIRIIREDKIVKFVANIERVKVKFRMKFLSFFRVTTLIYYNTYLVISSFKSAVFT